MNQPSINKRRSSCGRKVFLFLMIGCWTLFFPQTFLDAIGEILIENVSAKQRTPTKYLVIGDVTNSTSDSREVILRAQITFYEKASPLGDLPATHVRKDITVVLRGGERRHFEIPLILEGTLPAGSLRMEPALRIRRQREWVYE